MRDYPEYFLLDETMYHHSQIEMLSLFGGASGYGCWGKIRLRGEDEWDIGDGSYAHDHGPSGRHIRHRVAMLADGPDFNFTTLRAIMRGGISSAGNLSAEGGE